MKSDNLLKRCIKSLSNTDKKIINLLTNKELSKKEFISFLDVYDLDKENATSSFMLNELIDKFSLKEDDHPLIPRIVGLKEYFRFHNATALMNIPEGNEVLDLDLYLKIKYPDKIRPFTSKMIFSDKSFFVRFAGEKFINKVLENPDIIHFQGKDMVLPNEKMLAQLIYMTLHLAIINGRNSHFTICYIYDAYIHCINNDISGELNFKLTKKRIRHFLRRLKNKILRK